MSLFQIFKDYPAVKQWTDSVRKKVHHNENGERLENNVDLIMSTLRKDIGIIVTDTGNETVRSSIESNLDHLETSIRELCDFQAKSDTTEDVNGKKEYMSKLIDDIIDILEKYFGRKTWRMSKRRHIKSTVCVLGLLKREVCHFLDVLVALKTRASSSITRERSKSFQYIEATPLEISSIQKLRPPCISKSLPSCKSEGLSCKRNLETQTSFLNETGFHFGDPFEKEISLDKSDVYNEHTVNVKKDLKPRQNNLDVSNTSNAESQCAFNSSIKGKKSMGAQTSFKESIYSSCNFSPECQDKQLIDRSTDPLSTYESFNFLNGISEIIYEWIWPRNDSRATDLNSSKFDFYSSISDWKQEGWIWGSSFLSETAKYINHVKSIFMSICPWSTDEFLSCGYKCMNYLNSFGNNKVWQGLPFGSVDKRAEREEVDTSSVGTNSDFRDPSESIRQSNYSSCIANIQSIWSSDSYSVCRSTMNRDRTAAWRGNESDNELSSSLSTDTSSVTLAQRQRKMKRHGLQMLRKEPLDPTPPYNYISDSKFSSLYLAGDEASY